ncbi:MAG TPA: alpha-L-arabinofuranosidase C-terminal domain-containing protein [Mobilitalea sp.]|nr:alpha-L-arabinofuranosidase C-terminal domain-containing protein [Mobilitalea sp.]
MKLSDGSREANMRITVDALKTKENLGDLYGIFFEDINHAADGGLYAELVQNRSFEFASIDNEQYHPLTAWEKIERDGEARVFAMTGNPVSNKNPHYLAVDVMVPGSDVGVQNLGYNTGIPFQKSESYYFTCYAKREQDLAAPIKISFRSKEGEIYTAQEILLNKEWIKYELEFISPCTDYSGRLALTVSGRGRVYFDFVSLFPKNTFKGRRNGLRRDIAEKLAELKPKFMRFPGGCLVHDGALDPDVRDSLYFWKNTIGPLEDRPARRNNWGYNQTLGLGYYEYFQFGEDIGAKPLPVLAAGWNPHYSRAVTIEELQPWIDDALDLIEFANGDTSTTWGRKRAELGHAAPFGLEYIAIGNEEVGTEFFERYAVIHKAIREKYPKINIINSSGPFSAGGEYDRGWNSARENQSDLVDEHYYTSPEWMLANHHRYDSFRKDEPKVFLGEYASWGNTYYNALVEASYMIGLEKNAHAVSLACYAPMLCNADYVNWRPDMIWFNNHQVYGTANYYVQKLFMNHQGDYLLDVNATDVPESVMITEDPDKLNGDIIISSNDTTVNFTDLVFINEDTGENLKFADFMLHRVNKEAELYKVDCNNYTLRLKARKTEGFKGFTIQFGKKDHQNKLIWEIGGWQNQDCIIGEDINGRNTVLSQYRFSCEKNVEYQLELKVNNRGIQTFINGEAYNKTESKPVLVEPLYYCASREEATGDVIIKVVNVSNQDRTASIELKNFNASHGKVYTLEGYDLGTENDFVHPERIIPSEKEIKPGTSAFEYGFAKQSVHIFRLNQN